VLLLGFYFNAVQHKYLCFIKFFWLGLGVFFTLATTAPVIALMWWIWDVGKFLRERALAHGFSVEGTNF
jgi:hypothetical protein